MRLTLRTMLAYMDDILEADSAQLIKKKIEESEFASSLLHRTRDSMRRLRLGAPKVLGHGVGLDPNTVAEYLDNTLRDDRVPDFEKVCLESDVHLAEVASCHQVLAMVLGEPAEVEPVARQRMYQLAHLPMSGDEPGAKESVSTAAEGADAADAARARQKPTIPDYLREPERKRRLRPVLVWLAIAALVAVAVLIALGQFSRDGRLAKLLGLGGEDEVARVEPTSAGEPETGQGAVSELPSGPTPPTGPEKPEEAGSPPPGPKEPATPSAKQPGPGPSAKPPSVVPEEPLGKPGESGPTPPLPGPIAKPSGKGPISPPSKPDEPGALEPKEGVEVAKLPSDVVIDGSPAKEGPVKPLPPGTKPSPEKPAAEPAPVPPETLGQLVTDRAVLARYDLGTENWFRVEAHKPLRTQQRLLALPTYEPQMVLTSGPGIQLMGGTQIEFLPQDTQAVPGLVLLHGRLIIRTMGHPEATLRVQIGDRHGMISLLDPEATIAVQATPLRVPGTDPEQVAGYLSVDLYATAGQSRWQEQGSDPVLLKAPAWLTLSDQDQGAVEVSEFPEWISEAVGLLDRTKLDFHSVLDRQRTSGTLEKEIDKDKRIGFSLNEVVARHPQKEVKRLALRCLTATGEFDDVVAALDDPDEKLFWSDLTPVQAALARGPQVAASLREAFVKRYGQEDGTELYNMLWRPTADNLTRADAERLIGYLEHEALAFRVLAFWNLQRITGQGHFYRPDQSEQDRRKRVAMWQRALEDGRIKTIEPKASKPAPP